VDKNAEGKETPVSDDTPKKPEPAPAGATAPAAASSPAAPTAAAPGDKIDISEFAKVELRAARITSAEKVAGSKKLVKLSVDMGGEVRQVVAGIAESYDPDALVGKTIVLVANLKPAKLMGVESNGMVLAGSENGRAVLCTFDSSVAPGTKVK
jgi:methionyl-tRNA synthetase